MVDELQFHRVIGWGFVKKGTDQIRMVPLIWRFDADPTMTLTLPTDETPLAVIPEVQRTFKVEAVYAKGEPTETTVHLGYAIDFATQPDWEEEFRNNNPNPPPPE